MKKLLVLSIFILSSLSLFAQLNITVYVQVVSPNGGLMDSVPVSLIADVCTPIGHQSSGITLPGIGYEDNFYAFCTQGQITATVSCPGGGAQTAVAFYNPSDTVITITVACANSPTLCNAGFTYDSTGFYPIDLTNSYYYWDFGNGTSSTLVSPPNNLGVGNYSVCLYTETMTGDSCFACQNVTVSPPNNCSGNLTTTNVQGFTYNFQGNPVGTPPFTFNWDFGDGNSATTGASTTTHTYSSPGLYGILLQTIDANNLACYYYDSLFVSNTSNCLDSILVTTSGNTANFMLANGGTFGNYYWDFGDGTTSTQAAPSHYYTSAGTYTILVIYTTPNGLACTYTTTIQIGTNVPGCIDPSLIDFSVVCPIVTSPVCGCDSVTYDNSCIAESYFGISSWTSGPCLNNPNPSCQVTGSFQYYMVPDSNGTTIHFIGSSSPAGATFSWEFGDSTTATGSSVSHYYSSPNGPTTQAFTICMTAGLSPICADTYCETLVIVVNPFGTAGGGIYEGVNFTGPGDPMPNVTVNLESPTGAILYTDVTDQSGHYDFGQLPFGHYVVKIDDPTINHLGQAIELSPIHPTADSLDFNVNTDGSVNTGVENTIGIDRFTLTPNPANHSVAIELSVSSSLTADVALISVTGQRLYSKQMTLQQGDHSVLLDLDAIGQGVYVLLIRTAEGQVGKRLIRL